MTTTLRYQALVVEKDNCNYASVPDLKCQATGPSVGEAVASVEEQARRVLQEYEGATVDPPRPSRLTVALIELPAPPRNRPHSLRLVARRSARPTLATRS